MTGIMVAVAAAGGLTFASGLYGPFGADALPATASGTSIGGSTITINYTWLGYLRPSISGTNTMTINSVWDQFVIIDGITYNFDWGGSPSSGSAPNGPYKPAAKVSPPAAATATMIPVINLSPHQRCTRCLWLL